MYRKAFDGSIEEEEDQNDKVLGSYFNADKATFKIIGSQEFLISALGYLGEKYRITSVSRFKKNHNGPGHHVFVEVLEA